MSQCQATLAPDFDTDEIHFLNSTDHVYNLFVGVAGETGVTTGEYTLDVDIAESDF